MYSQPGGRVDRIVRDKILLKRSAEDVLTNQTERKAIVHKLTDKTDSDMGSATHLPGRRTDRLKRRKNQNPGSYNDTFPRLPASPAP